jgi:hypothetical protein
MTKPSSLGTGMLAKLASTITKPFSDAVNRIWPFDYNKLDLNDNEVYQYKLYSIKKLKLNET